MQTRRDFLTSTAGGIGAAIILPYASHAATGGSDSFATDNAQITIHPVNHASFVMEVPGLVIYNDPVGNASAYAKFPKADLILISHHHGDHFKPNTVAGLMSNHTKILANPTVYEKLPAKLKAAAISIGNGDTQSYDKVKIEAVPAYNYTAERTKYHPKGRDNGYVVNVDGRRVYIAGDTEDVPEMSDLKNIDIAFLPMILPYTMDVVQAAAGVGAFAPKHVYPYHYGKTDTSKFAKLVAEGASGAEVHAAKWY